MYLTYLTLTMETWLQVMFSGISIAQTLHKKTIEAYHHLILIYSFPGWFIHKATIKSICLMIVSPDFRAIISHGTCTSGVTSQISV